MKDDRFGYGWYPYILPYGAFVMLAQFSGDFPERWWLPMLLVKPAVPAGLIYWYWRQGMYPELRGFGEKLRGLPLDLLLGALSGVLWMAPYLLAPDSVGERLLAIDTFFGAPWPDPQDAFDPARAGAQFATLAIALRLIGYACITPLFEELFIRSFVMRFADVFDTGQDFRDLPIARYSARSFWIATVFFTFGHVLWEWWVAVPWVMASSAWFYYRGHLGAVIAFHAAANATILLAAIALGGSFWMFV